MGKRKKKSMEIIIWNEFTIKVKKLFYSKTLIGILLPEKWFPEKYLIDENMINVGNSYTYMYTI